MLWADNSIYAFILLSAGTNATLGCKPAIFDFYLGVNTTGLLPAGRPLDLLLTSFTNASVMANVTWQVSVRAPQAASYATVGNMSVVPGAVPSSGLLSAWRFTVPASYVALVSGFCQSVCAMCL